MDSWCPVFARGGWMGGQGMEGVWSKRLARFCQLLVIRFPCLCARICPFGVMAEIVAVANPIFKAGQDKVDAVVAKLKRPAAVKDLVKAPLFCPGEWFKGATKAGISFASLDKEEVLNDLLEISTSVPTAKYKQNGFWPNHWTHTLDLLEISFRGGRFRSRRSCGTRRRSPSS